jgi:hypothetical protein
VEQIDDQPIILTTITRPFDFEADTRALHLDGSALIDTIGDQVWSIMDLSQLNMSFSELMIGMAMTATDTAFGMDSRTSHLVFIGNDAMVAMAALGLKQDQYGGIFNALIPYRRRGSGLY